MSELKHEVEKVFASVAKLEPEEHKNVLGDKWKFINAVVTFIQNRESPTNEVCPECGDTGAGKPTLESPDGYPCPTCQGTGMGIFHHNSKAPCETCKGTGKSSPDVCPICDGEGKLLQYADGQREEMGCDYCQGTGKSSPSRDLRDELLKTLTKLLGDCRVNIGIDLTPYISQIIALFGDEEDELKVVDMIRKQERERIIGEIETNGAIIFLDRKHHQGKKLWAIPYDLWLVLKGERQDNEEISPIKAREKALGRIVKEKVKK